MPNNTWSSVQPKNYTLHPKDSAINPIKSRATKILATIPHTSSVFSSSPSRAATRGVRKALSPLPNSTSLTPWLLIQSTLQAAGSVCHTHPHTQCVPYASTHSTRSHSHYQRGFGTAGASLWPRLGRWLFLTPSAHIFRHLLLFNLGCV